MATLEKVHIFNSYEKYEENKSSVGQNDIAFAPLQSANFGSLIFNSYDLTSDIKYIRFNNGLQIVYARYKQNVVTFPVAFIDDDYTASVSFWQGAEHEGYASEYCFTNKTATSINVKGTSNGGKYRDLLCIGRWK